LFGLTVFYSLKPNYSFRLIPLSLVLVMLPIMVGPLSPKQVAKNSQWDRLIGFLESEELMLDGQLVKNAKEISSTKYNDLRSVIMYLKSHYGSGLFESLLEGIPKEEFKLSEDDELLALRAYRFSSALMDYTGLVSVQEGVDNAFLEVSLEEPEGISVDKPSRLYQHSIWWNNDFYDSSFLLKGDEYRFKINREDAALEFYDAFGQQVASLLLKDWLGEQLEANVTRPQELKLAQDELRFSVNLLDKGTIDLQFTQLSLYLAEEEWKLNRAILWVLVEQD